MKRSYIHRSQEDYRNTGLIETNATSLIISPATMGNHVASRARCSLIAGVDLILAYKTGILPKGQPFPVGAYAQDDKGTRKGPVKTDAAHALPCGILIGNVPVPEYAAGSAGLRMFLTEPYRYTNVIPKVANKGDHRAEAFGEPAPGQGLVATFTLFCRKLYDDAIASQRLDRTALRMHYSDLMKGYADSLRYHLQGVEDELRSKTPPRPAWPSAYNEITPEELKAKSDAAYQELDAMRSGIHHQLIATEEMGEDAYSSPLVEEVEHDFHATLESEKGSAQESSSSSAASGTDGE